MEIHKHCKYPSADLPCPVKARGLSRQELDAKICMVNYVNENLEVIPLEMKEWLAVYSPWLISQTWDIGDVLRFRFLCETLPATVPRATSNTQIVSFGENTILPAAVNEHGDDPKTSEDAWMNKSKADISSEWGLSSPPLTSDRSSREDGKSTENEVANPAINVALALQESHDPSLPEILSPRSNASSSAFVIEAPSLPSIPPPSASTLSRHQSVDKLNPALATLRPRTASAQSVRSQSTSGHRESPTGTLARPSIVVLVDSGGPSASPKKEKAQPRLCLTSHGGRVDNFLQNPNTSNGRFGPTEMALASKLDYIQVTSQQRMLQDIALQKQEEARKQTMAKQQHKRSAMNLAATLDNALEKDIDFEDTALSNKTKLQLMKSETVKQVREESNQLCESLSQSIELLHTDLTSKARAASASEEIRTSNVKKWQSMKTQAALEEALSSREEMSRKLASIRDDKAQREKAINTRVAESRSLQRFKANGRSAVRAVTCIFSALADRTKAETRIALRDAEYRKLKEKVSSVRAGRSPFVRKRTEFAPKGSVVDSIDDSVVDVQFAEDDKDSDVSPAVVTDGGGSSDQGSNDSYLRTEQYVKKDSSDPMGSRSSGQASKQGRSTGTPKQSGGGRHSNEGASISALPSGGGSSRSGNHVSVPSTGATYHALVRFSSALEHGSTLGLGSGSGSASTTGIRTSSMSHLQRLDKSELAQESSIDMRSPIDDDFSVNFKKSIGHGAKSKL